jgi:hypothetical protein
MIEYHLPFQDGVFQSQTMKKQQDMDRLLLFYSRVIQIEYDVGRGDNQANKTRHNANYK